MAELIIGLLETEVTRQRGHWEVLTMSRSLRCNGLSGSTTAAFSGPSATSHPPNSKSPITASTSQLRPQAGQNTSCTKLGVVDSWGTRLADSGGRRRRPWGRRVQEPESLDASDALDHEVKCAATGEQRADS